MSWNQIKFDKDIPLPESRSKKFNLDEMEVGDSFFLPIADYKTPSSTYCAASQAVRPYKKHKHLKFIIRKVDDGFRVWRTA